MKVGQALSVMEVAIPDEFGEAWARPSCRTPLPASKVRRVLDGQLGASGSGSLVQRHPSGICRHRPGAGAIWSDGREWPSDPIPGDGRCAQ